jgi:hypothetical protein
MFEDLAIEWFRFALNCGFEHLNTPFAALPQKENDKKNFKRTHWSGRGISGLTLSEDWYQRANPGLKRRMPVFCEGYGNRLKSQPAFDICTHASSKQYQMPGCFHNEMEKFSKKADSGS